MFSCHAAGRRRSSSNRRFPLYLPYYPTPSPPHTKTHIFFFNCLFACTGTHSSRRRDRPSSTRTRGTTTTAAAVAVQDETYYSSRVIHCVQGHYTCKRYDILLARLLYYFIFFLLTIIGHLARVRHMGALIRFSFKRSTNDSLCK